MAHRAPAHVTLAYPEEFDDEVMLLARTREATRDAFAFSVAIHGVGCEVDREGGVWFLVDDSSGIWASLRAQILSAPFRTLGSQPHITIVHPRTSKQGRAALAALAHSTFTATFNLNEVIYTETSDEGMRVIERFPLQSVTHVVGAVLRRGREVLLCLRTRDRASYPGAWDIPGGHVEKTEAPVEALVRELEEELGIVARIDSSRRPHVFRIGGIELSVFVVDEWQGEPRNRAIEEHDEIRWVSLDRLAELPLAHPSLLSVIRQEG
jgi:mutator protein MutT